MLGIPVAELRPRMTAKELSEWIAFERVTGPLLVQERVDVAAAHIIAGFASVMSGKPVSPERFLLDWDKANQQKQKQDPASMIAVMREIQAKREFRGDES